jgi:alpha-glucosidase
MAPADPTGTPWWQTGVLYQIYPRSFADSNGDGIGDLQGVIDHLDHLEALGIDGIWLSPVTVSPQADWGYDVADYCDIDPDYGDLTVLDALVAEAAGRGIRVLMDLVPNHTSDHHPWFVDALGGRDAAHRDYYVWADPKPDGSPPNNWVSSFGGPAWTLDAGSGQYYLHNFLPEQPDLNWWHDDVRRAIDDVLRFWWDRGVAGFRIDVCHMVVKDRELRDNPPAGPDDPLIEQLFGQRTVYNSNRPEVHDVIRRWRALADTYDPGRLLLGETMVDDVETLVTYYGHGADELNLAFNLPFIEAPLQAPAMRAVVAETESRLPPGAWPVWVGSNHDQSRLATRWAGGHPGKIRTALLILLTLRGTPVLYQGDEIGLPDGEISKDQLLDPVGLRFWPHYAGRDPERTPVPWDDSPGGGFTVPGVTPWLPLSTPPGCNVAAQDGDPASVLTFTRNLLALRRATRDLQLGDYRVLETPEQLWAWRRGDSVTVAVNLSDDGAALTGVAGTVALGTEVGRAGEAVDDGLRLAPWSGIVVVV